MPTNESAFPSFAPQVAKRRRRTLAVALAAASLLGGCSSTEQASPVGSSPPSSHAEHVSHTTVATPAGDRDVDRGRGRYYDEDDKEVIAFGHRAKAAEQRQIGDLIARYYAAAASGEGAAGCSMLYSLFAEGIVEDQGEEDAHAHGKSCAEILSRLFRRYRRQLTAARRRLRLTEARVEGPRGYAVLDLGEGIPFAMYLHRDSGRWTVESIQAAELG
jgi:hypothetical protein